METRQEEKVGGAYHHHRTGQWRHTNCSPRCANDICQSMWVYCLGKHPHQHSKMASNHSYLCTYYFMDPHVINEEYLMQWPNRTMKTIFNFLDKQHHMQYILLPYNFQWVIHPFFHHPFKLIISISNIACVYVYEQVPLDNAYYQDWSKPCHGAGPEEETKNRVPKLCKCA